MPPDVPRRLQYSVPEAAALLGVSESTVWVLLREGRLRGRKVGAARRISAAELERFVASEDDGAARGGGAA